MPLPKNFIVPFVTNRELAIRRHGLEPAVANRVAFTGLFAGGESPAMSILYTDLLAQREEPAAPPAPPAPTTPPPAEGQITVPTGIVGNSVDVGRKKLTEVGFGVAVFDRVDEKPRSTVLDVQPAEGARVPEGTTATLFVSKGPRDEVARSGEPSGRRGGG